MVKAIVKLVFLLVSGTLLVLLAGELASGSERRYEGTLRELW